MPANGKTSPGVFPCELILLPQSNLNIGTVMSEKFVLVCDYEHRVIWHDGFITERTASRFEKILKRLNKKLGPICFYIRGPGGDPPSTFKMMQLIMGSENPVACIAHDHVCSGCFTMTQAGEHRLALPGTRFVFHPSVIDVTDKVRFTQQALVDEVEKLRRTDGIQLMYFIRKGKPAGEIYELFDAEAVITVPRAIKLNLIDAYYKKEDFLPDRRRIRKLIKAR
jgi:ATP-dependent protease ClpP protease subunit